MNGFCGNRDRDGRFPLSNIRVIIATDGKGVEGEGGGLGKMGMIERHATDFIHVRLSSLIPLRGRGRMAHRGWNTKKAAFPDDEGYARRMRIPPWY